jgi:hypothetical protein
MGAQGPGLARLQALLENLRREIDWNDSKFIDCDTLSLTGTLTAKSGMTTGAQSTYTVMGATAGADLANDDADVNFVTEDSGKVFKCLLAGTETKKLNLPTDITAADVGMTIVIVQGALLGASAQLQVNTGASATFTANSYVLGQTASGTQSITQPAEANNRYKINGAATNSFFGIGSVLTCTLVAKDEWLLVGRCVPAGNGSTAGSFETA